MTGYDIQFMNLVALTMSLAKQRLAKDLELDFCLKDFIISCAHGKANANLCV